MVPLAARKQSSRQAIGKRWRFLALTLHIADPRGWWSPSFRIEELQVRRMLDSWHAAECVHICQREVFGSPIGFELPLGVGGQRIIISRLPSLLELAGLLAGGTAAKPPVSLGYRASPAQGIARLEVVYSNAHWPVCCAERCAVRCHAQIQSSSRCPVPDLSRSPLDSEQVCDQWIER